MLTKYLSLIHICVVEGLFKLWTAHAGFDGYCLVVLAEGDNLVEVLSHVERDAALDLSLIHI